MTRSSLTTARNVLAVVAGVLLVLSFLTEIPVVVGVVVGALAVGLIVAEGVVMVRNADPHKVSTGVH